MFCMQCGKQMPDHSLFCPFCGTPTPNAARKMAKRADSGPEKRQDKAAVENEAVDSGVSADRPVPEVSPVRPEQKPIKPEQNTAGAEQSPAKPGQKAAQPEQSPAKPGQKAAEAEQSPAKPEQKAAEAEQSPAKPGQKAAEAEQSPAKPEKNTAQPELDSSDQDSFSKTIDLTALEKSAAPKRMQGSLAQSPEYLQKLAEAEERMKAGPDKGKTESENVISRVFDADTTVTERIDPIDSDPKKQYAEKPGKSGPVPSSEKKEKPGRGKFLIAGGIALIAILAAVLVNVFNHNAKVKQYNEAVAQLDSKNYEEALELFTDLGSFEDSEHMASFAQMEIDYLTLDDLVAAGDYSRVIEILNSRSEFYGDSDTGKQAAALAGEYEKVSQAYAAMKEGNYAQAEKDFDSLDTLKADYAKDKCLCSAYIAESEHNWVNIITNLYAIQKNDTSFSFLDNPQSDEETMISEAYNSGKEADPDKVAEILQTEDPEMTALKDTSVNGLRYDHAKKLFDDSKYEEAMTAFEALDDFLDSESCYKEAKASYEACEAKYQAGKKYYDNGEYYKARKEFLSIKGYKKADEKAESCIQSMPDNGALKAGNGGIAFTITAPDIAYKVFVKLYDSDGNAVGQVFLHPKNSSTVNMAAGTYTIKVAYGSEWYGEKDLFGDGGIYYQLLNGSSTDFNMENGYTYTLELLKSADGNVGSKHLDGAGNM